MFTRIRRAAVIATAIVAGTIVIHAQRGTVAPARPAHDYPVKPVPFTAVHLKDEFWAPRIEINRTVTIPFAFEQVRGNGPCEQLRARSERCCSGEPLADRKPPGYPFDDTDIYKVIEGASLYAERHARSEARRLLDGLIAKIAAAQEKDGYLYTTRTIDPQHPHPWAGTARWALETDAATSCTTSDISTKPRSHTIRRPASARCWTSRSEAADLLVDTFGPGKRSIWPGHQITEMGLAKLYRVTGDERYLTLAKFMLDDAARTCANRPARAAPTTSRRPHVVDQTERSGTRCAPPTCIRAWPTLPPSQAISATSHAIDRIWENTVGRKLYITGGIGAARRARPSATTTSCPT